MTALLVIIYLAFISLGLPDALLGAAWPEMRLTLGASLPQAGWVSMIVTGGTIVSSLLSARLIHRFGTGRVTLTSVAMTAAALLGYSLSPNLASLCLMAIPLGLGAGAVDAALNNFVALNYAARHMSWLHCFWGVGATAGPMLMAVLLTGAGGWQQGYRTIAIMQLALVAALAASLPLWKKARGSLDEGAKKQLAPLTNRQALGVPGLKFALAAFFCYCAVEMTTGLWIASYLVEQRALPTATAALWSSLYYGGITAGRLFTGFMAIKMSGKALIRLGLALLTTGIACLIPAWPAPFALVGIVLIGLGCAPVYPCMIHETPARFGEQASQAAMGLQMATAYTGSTLMPPLFGLIGSRFSLGTLPWFLLALALCMVVLSEALNKRVKG